MKKTNLLTLCALLFVAATYARSGEKPLDYMEGFVTGTPAIQSINALAFGPQGILFIGDSKNASVFAIETNDSKGAKAMSVNMTGIDKKLAAALGTTPENINIQDMVVHPVSGKLYLAVHNADGTPALLRLEGDSFVPVKLDNVRYSSIGINNVVAEDAKDGRGRSLRMWAISDLGYYDNMVMVTGLSNQEFGSTFRSIPFPFRNEQDQASLEIFHVSHGRYETQSPIKTFTAAELDGAPYLIASYTCTPLVLFPLEDLKSGKHVKGRTVAELGNRNTPLDIITMRANGKSWLVLANSSREMMKISYDDIAKFKETLTTPLADGAVTAGVNFVALPYKNVTQLDKLDDDRFVMIQKKENGSLDLVTVETKAL